MILKNDFYEVVQFRSDGSEIQSVLKLNPEHRIFEGHFPGQPVVPGVCMVQMIKELMETALEKTLRMQQSDHIKFLSVIDPVQQKLIEVNIQYVEKEDGKYMVSASMQAADKTCFKMKALFCC